MDRYVIRVLQLVIAVALLGSVVVQALLLPLLWVDMEDLATGPRVVVVASFFLGVLCLQVIAVCILRLLGMVRRGTVFSGAAFRYVDVVIGAIATGSLLVLAVAAVSVVLNRTTAGDVVPPGIVGLMCGIALVIAGVALVVYVMRTLLVQAVETAARAEHLRSELDEVI